MNDRDIIDFHTHILPAMDDGSRDLSMTEAMLLDEARQGVAKVVATPHFYAERTSMDRFLQKRQAAYGKLKELTVKSSNTLPEVLCGAEVYFFPGIGRAERIPELCIGDTNTLLLEMPFEQWTDSVLKDVRSLALEHRLDIVIAHIERYIGFQRDREVWNHVFRLPVTPQINAGSFLRKGGLFRPDRKRRFCISFLRERPDTILASDCHDTADRPPNVARAREAIAAELGQDTLKRMDAAAQRALQTCRHS